MNATELIAALAVHTLPPDLFAAVTAALVLGEQACRQTERIRVQAAERQRRKRAGDAEACHVTLRDATTEKKVPPHPPIENKQNQKKRDEDAYRLPIDWKVEGDDLAYAEAAELDVERTTSDFVRYWRECEDERAWREDWSEAWRYHCDRYGRRPRRVRQGSPMREPARRNEPRRAAPGNPFLAEARKCRQHIMSRDALGVSA